jgi:hypothetical protein
MPIAGDKAVLVSNILGDEHRLGRRNRNSAIRTELADRSASVRESPVHRRLEGYAG